MDCKSFSWSLFFPLRDRRTDVSSADGNFRVVVPFPFDGGLRRAISATRQRDVGALSDDNVARAERIVDRWWNWKLTAFLYRLIGIEIKPQLETALH